MCLGTVINRFNMQLHTSYVRQSPYSATITSGKIFDSMKKMCLTGKLLRFCFVLEVLRNLHMMYPVLYMSENFLDFPFSNIHTNAASVRLLN